MNDINGGDVSGGFDDYDDFDSATESEGNVSEPRTAESTEDEKLDAIVDLLGGNSEKADAISEAGTKVSRKDFSSRSIGADGRPTYDSHESGAEQGVTSNQSTSRYGFNADTPGSRELIEGREQAEQLYQQAFKAKEEIERQLAEGMISDQQAQEALHIAGQYAGRAQHEILTNELQQRDARDYQQQAYGHIAREFDIDPNDTEAVNKALGEAVTFLRSCHISDADLATVDDPAIAITAIRAHRAIENESALKDEVAGLKAQVRRLKKARGEGRRSGRKASQAGVTGDKQSAMLDEVVALLGGNR